MRTTLASSETGRSCRKTLFSNTPVSEKKKMFWRKHIILNATENNKTVTKITLEIYEFLIASIAALYEKHLDVTAPVTLIAYDTLPTSAAWKTVVEAVGHLPHIKLNELQTAERFALFINIYNLLVIHAIVAGNRPSNLYSRLRFYATMAYNIGGMTLSLNDIEHGILRANKPMVLWFQSLKESDEAFQYRVKEFDYRIHFAINCGAYSCPPVRLYTSQGIDELLHQATVDFINNDSHVLLNLEDKTITLSMLLSFYKTDFLENGSMNSILQDVLMKYLSEEKQLTLSKLLKDPSLKIKFFTYDWTINNK